MISTIVVFLTDIYHSEYLKRKKDIFFLTSFIILAAILSTVVMDLLIFPITEFAKKQTSLFNSLIGYSLLFFISFTFFYKIYKKISYLKKTNSTNSSIFFYILQRPIKFLTTFIIMLLITSILVISLYFILNSNNNLIRNIIPS